MSLRAGTAQHRRAEHQVPHTEKLEQGCTGFWFSGKSKVGCSQGELLLGTVRESLLWGSLLSAGSSLAIFGIPWTVNALL